jgi:putative transposase
MTTKTKVPNKNLQKTFYQSSISTAVAKWEKEVIQKFIKSRKISLKLSPTRKEKIDKWIHASRYVYNKIVYEINTGFKKSKLDARNLFVTRKDNDTINEWEFETPKDIRAGAVFDCYKAYKTGFSQLKSGLIKCFRIGYKSRKRPEQCIVIPKSVIKYRKEKFEIIYLKEFLSYSKRTKKFLENHTIDFGCRIIVQKGKYWLVVPLSKESKKCDSYDRYCGIDPGCRTFMTVVSNYEIIEYKHNQDTLKLLNTKIDLLKTLRVRKRHLNIIETRKTNLVNELHWKTIRDILNKNDIVMYGDIKSSSVVKNNQNKTLNRTFNDLKFFKFKQRLLYKALTLGKKVFEIPEQYTSQTCSSCGNIYKPGSSNIYNCSKCFNVFDRDINVSKNILMKGILKYL